MNKINDGGPGGSMNTEQERAAFEAWCQEKYSHPNMERNLDGYISTATHHCIPMTYASVQMLWEAWQARAALQSQDKRRVYAGLKVESVLRQFLTGDGFIAECDIQHIVAALTAHPAAVDGEMMERIAALLYEETTGESWTVANVEHYRFERAYYRRLAHKVATIVQERRAEGMGND